MEPGYKIFLLLFCTFAVIAFPQLYQPKVGIPKSWRQVDNFLLQNPEYRIQHTISNKDLISEIIIDEK